MDQQVLQPVARPTLESTRPTEAQSAYHHYAASLAAYQGSMVPVPELSRLLGVKTTTLNARFRREGEQVTTVGRTNYLPYESALKLGALHKYALLGWPTLLEASRLTLMKSATLKARCEKGQLEAYLDLTKRLRINPEEVGKLAWPRSQNRLNETGSEPAVAKDARRKPVRNIEWHPSAPRPILFRTAPDPEVKFITERDYGLPETTLRAGPDGGNLKPRVKSGKTTGCLSYDPDRPFSVAQCAVGKAIRYGPHEGRILKVFDDPFSPRILVRFPGHDLPVMREVCLIVEKRQR